MNTYLHFIVAGDMLCSTQHLTPLALQMDI